jgi:hypothetical protein
MPSQCGGLAPTIVGTFADDELTEADGDNVIIGGPGDGPGGGRTRSGSTR